MKNIVFNSLRFRRFLEDIRALYNGPGCLRVNSPLLFDSDATETESDATEIASDVLG